MEEWRNINNDYSVSNLGRVKSNERTVIRSNGRTHFIRERILKPAKDNKGYLRVGLTLNGKLKTFKVHRLVAEAFIDNSLNLPQVNHINGIKDENSVLNLEWCTNQYNVQHAYDNNMIDVAKGEKHHNSKLTKARIEEAKGLYNTGKYSYNDLGVIYNVSKSAIMRAIKGQTWNH